VLKNYSILLIITAIFLIFQSEEAFCKNDKYYQTDDDTSTSRAGSSTGKVLSIRLEHDISLNNLITKSGYKIDDEDVLSFLTEFSNMNEGIKSISVLKKGALVKLPLKNLTKVAKSTVKTKKKTELKAVKKRKRRQKAKKAPEIKGSGIDRAMILRNIKTLSYSLDENIFVETGGLKVFTVSGRSEISFDTSFFPVIALSKGHILVLDYKGILPEEIKNIVEVSWPEYRFVNTRGLVDLNKIIRPLLDAMGYYVHSNKKIIVGGRTQIEYLADFVIFKKDRDIIDSRITIIGIVGVNEYATPERLVSWLKEKDIKLIELSYDETKKTYNEVANIMHTDSTKDAQEFTETLLSLMGYKFTRDKVLSISDRKEYKYNLKADLSINLGYRTKVVEFAELSDYEINYAKKRGFDVVCIKPSDERKIIVNQIMSLLSLNYKNSSRRNSSYITPKRVKYRLLSPGIFVNSKNGPLFITDSKLDQDLLKQIIAEKYTILTY
jgi:hypothetical protein